TVGTLTLDGATMSTVNTRNVNGGNITVDATTVALTNGGSIVSSTGLDFASGLPVGTGTGGNVTIQGLQAGSAANSVTLSGGGGISTQTFGPGRGGKVQVTADTLTMDLGFITTGSFIGDGV